MEYLGDGVLDIYCINSLYKLANIRKDYLSPYKLHNFKVFFLSSEPLGRLCVSIGLHELIEIDEITG